MSANVARSRRMTRSFGKVGLRNERCRVLMVWRADRLAMRTGQRDPADEERRQGRAVQTELNDTTTGRTIFR